MGQQFAYADIVHNRGLIRVVDGGLNGVLLDFFAHQPGKLVVHRVPWPRGYNPTFDGTADKSHVTDDVQQLVAGTLVLPHQWAVLYITYLLGIHMGHLEYIGQLVEFLLAHLAFIDDDGVVQVATLNQVGFQQGHDVAYEDECAGRGYLLGKVVDVVEGGKLAIDKLGLERAHRGDAKLLIGQNGDTRTVLVVLDFYFFTDYIEIFGSVLFLYAYLFDLLDILHGRAVEDGELWAVDLYQTVIYAEGIQGCHAMLYGTYPYVATGQYGAALGVGNFLGYRVYDGLVLQVYTLYLVSMVLRRGIERYGQVQSRVQSFSKE